MASKQKMYDRRIKWADALDSGEYKQGYGQLTRHDTETGDNEHCCLGVWCKLRVDDGQLTTRTNHEVTEYASVGSSLGDVYEVAYLSEEEYRYLGLRSEHGSFQAENGFNAYAFTDYADANSHIGISSLTEANDGSVPFTAIAQFIREQAQLALDGKHSILFVSGRWFK